jgi:hypothetical protein
VRTVASPWDQSSSITSASSSCRGGNAGEVGALLCFRDAIYDGV